MKPPTKRPTKPNARIADRRRRELLDAAFAVIAEKGLEGLRTRDIAKRAGVNIATLHYHFGRKDALVLAVARHVRDIFIAQHWSGDAAPDLAAHFAAVRKSFAASPALATVLLELTLRAKRDAVARRALRSIHAHWNALVESLLLRGIADGVLDAGLDVPAGARIITSLIIGATIELGINPKAFDYDDLACEFERWLAPGKRRNRLGGPRAIR